MPWEGRLRLPPFLHDVQVRIAVAPLPAGDAVTMRILSHEQILRPMSDWGLSQSAFSMVYRILHQGSGLTLVTGPTGAGKTTTVYSMLNILAEDKRNVVSIEDPIEYETAFVRQLAVTERHGLTMSAGVAILLRMDPDVIFVGEIRDVKTAHLAMQAANSGKYVFSTLHTRDVAATITALRDLEVDNRSLAANLAGIINQRLVRRLCTCARRTAVSDYEREVIAEAGLTAPGELRRPRGCVKCRQTGYHGRTGVFEALVLDGPTAEAVTRGASEAELRQELRRMGAPTLRIDALKKALEGITSFDEAQRIAHMSAAPMAPSPV
jgi:general secretion pathway protein E